MGTTARAAYSPSCGDDQSPRRRFGYDIGLGHRLICTLLYYVSLGFIHVDFSLYSSIWHHTILALTFTVLVLHLPLFHAPFCLECLCRVVECVNVVLMIHF
jgi:hypothetical protein